MRTLRVWLIGFGTVGRWVASQLDERGEWLAARHGVSFRVTGLATRRDGFIHTERGLDLGRALRQAVATGSLADLPEVRRWPTTMDALTHGKLAADVLVEVTASPAVDGQPGFDHLCEALRRGMAVVTSNKWPVALHGVELAALARERGLPFRAESTVMSGTPVLAALRDGLGGAIPERLRGLLNATANAILTSMARGDPYATALSEAQAAGIAERDPEADVEGHDTVAKVMILSSLVFGRQLAPAQVARHGISRLLPSDFAAAAAVGGRIKHVATLEVDTADRVVARVQPEVVHTGDSLWGVDGVTNAVVCRARPLGEVTIIGPGAGVELAGLGVLSDLIQVASGVS